MSAAQAALKHGNRRCEVGSSDSIHASRGDENVGRSPLRAAR